MATEDLFLPTPIEYATPEQVKSSREYAKALLYGSQQQPVNHWTQGISNMVNALMGGIEMRKAALNENAMLKNNKGAQPFRDDDAVAGPGAPAGAGVVPPKEPAMSFAPEERKQPGGKRGIVVSTGPVKTDNMEIDPSRREATFDERFGVVPPTPAAPLTRGARALPFDADQSVAANGGVAPDAPSAIAMALAKGAANKGAVPGAPATPTDATGHPTYVNPELLPKRPQISRQQYLEVVANPYASAEDKKFARDAYYGQNQPIQLNVPGGQVLASPKTGTQQYIPELKDNTIEADGVKVSSPTMIVPDGKGGYVRRVIPDEATGGAPPALGAPKKPTAPSLSTIRGGQAPTVPGALPFAAEGDEAPPGMLGLPPPGFPTQPAGPEVAGKGTQTAQVTDRMQSVADWAQKRKLDFERQKDLNAEDNKYLTKKYDTVAEAGQRAHAGLPILQMARELIDAKDDQGRPTMYQGIGNNLVLDFQRLGSQLGIVDPSRVANAQTFTKAISGQIIEDMKIMLQGLGQVRVAEIDLLSKASANLSNSPDANRAVIAIALRAHQQADQIAQAATAYRDGFELDKDGEWVQSSKAPTRAGLDQTMRRVIDAYPVMSPAEVAHYNKLFKPGSYNDAEYKRIKSEFQSSMSGKPTEGSAAPTKKEVPPLPGVQ